MGTKYIEDINDLEMDKWISNLRSGSFQQTRGMLVSSNDDGSVGYCCLGVQAVGCGLTAKKHEDGEYMGIQFSNKFYAYLPPVEVLSRLNVPDEYLVVEDNTASVRVLAREGDPPAYISDGGMLISVSTLNDTMGLDFNQIADRLEETFLRKE